MKYKIANPKRTILMTSIILIIIAIIVLILLSCFELKKETMAKPQNEEEQNIEELEEKIEEPDGEYIDIEELEEEQQEEEKNEEQNVIEENTQKNETTNNVKNTTNTMSYYIKVNYGAQVVTIYKKDEAGNYTIPIKAMVCSTGVATPTSGVYAIPARWEWLGLQGDVYGHYCTQIKGNILFHSVPYLRRWDPASLEYWEYDKLGTYASAGCIRLMIKDAKWIYENCARGTKVEFYSSSNPGPLGKPSAKKISTYPDYLRNWDPTDPNASNPWHTYKEETTQTTPKNEIATNVVQNNTLNEVTNSIENDRINTISNEIETNKNNIITNETVNETINEIVNEIVNEITNEQQNEINKDTNIEKQNTIEQNNKVEKLNTITNEVA